MTLELSITWGVPAHVIYDALTSEQQLAMCTRARATVEARPGGVYSLYDGQITGAFLELTPKRRIAQEWAMKGWERPSKVTIELQEYDGDSCCMKVTQSGLPSGMAADRMRGGWLEQIFRPMSLLLGFPIMSQD